MAKTTGPAQDQAPTEADLAQARENIKAAQARLLWMEQQRVQQQASQR